MLAQMILVLAASARFHLSTVMIQIIAQPILALQVFVISSLSRAIHLICVCRDSAIMACANISAMIAMMAMHAQKTFASAADSAIMLPSFVMMQMFAMDLKPVI